MQQVLHVLVGTAGSCRSRRNVTRVHLTRRGHVSAVVTATLEFMLMLVAMTFNVGLFICVIAGLALGTLLFGHILAAEPSFGYDGAHPVTPCDTCPRSKSLAAGSGALLFGHILPAELSFGYDGAPLSCDTLEHLFRGIPPCRSRHSQYVVHHRCISC